MKHIEPYHGAGIQLWTTRESLTSVLLVLRAIPPQKGSWSIPGGGWERRKDGFDTKGKPDYRATAIRECREEIFFSIEDPQKLTLLWQIHLPFFHYVVSTIHLPYEVSVSWTMRTRKPHGSPSIISQHRRPPFWGARSPRCVIWPSTRKPDPLPRSFFKAC